MPIALIKAQARQYTLISIMLVVSWFLSSHFAGTIDTQIMAAGHHSSTLLVLFSTVIIFSLGFVVYELAKPTVIPSFVLAILFGMVCRDILSLIIQNPNNLVTLITVGAVLILFDGGLDMPFSKFKNLLSPILSLAFIGTIINALLLSLILKAMSGVVGTPMPIIACILLGAAVASTDPAAIIPCFKDLQFKKARVKYIAISESAINDVVGAVLVMIFLAVFSAGFKPKSILEGYESLLQISNGVLIIQACLVGISVGILGFFILNFWSKWKERQQTEDGTDSALFLAVPLFAFTIAELLGGSGFLAVFIAGLLFHVRVHFRHVEHYFNHTVEGFMKPMIFMLLGAMVSPEQMAAYAPLGLIMSLFTIFILRPLIVLMTLTPFCFGKHKMTWQELTFLSFVRETGVIPAALLITIGATNITDFDGAIIIGLWVILMTLIIQPPLTPLLARRLCIATQKTPLPERKHSGPVVVLCSRGFSFPERMQTVVEWALEHRVENVVLLHCPEEKYSTDFVADVEQRAQALFENHNKKLEDQGKKHLNFEFLCGPGLLQDNIESLIAEGDVSIIFVGSKMLDYRIEDVKRLNVPFYFI